MDLTSILQFLGNADKIGLVLLCVGAAVNMMSYELKMRGISVAMLIAGAVWASHGKWGAILS